MSWGRYGYLQVKMECVTAYQHGLHNINPTTSYGRLQMFSTFLWFAVSHSNRFCLCTQRNTGKQQMNPDVCETRRGHCLLGRMSSDVSVKKSPGSWKKQMLNSKSCCKVSLTIPNIVTVKTQILLCSIWSNIPTLTQLTSMWSICYNIQYIAQQQS